MVVFVLYGFALGLCEGACVYVHDTLCITMLIVTTEDPPEPQHQTPCSIAEGRSEMDNNDSPILGFECPMTDGLLGPEVPRRSYQMLQRVATE